MPKATQVHVLQPGEFEPPKEQRQCPICGKPTRHPYAKTSKGEWLCQRKCSEEYDTKALTLPVLDILAGDTARHLGDIVP